jgi:hypothetical protein
LTEQNTIIVCYLKLVRILMWYSVYNWWGERIYT